MEVVVGSNLCFFPLFFFFFFLWVREAALPPKPRKVREGNWSPGPQKGQRSRNSAPSSGTTCSLELSLPSPAGIWFKTPLPVGGANTANNLVAHRPKPRRLQRPGVWGSPPSRILREYPLNLQGASCPTLARWSQTLGGPGRRTRPPLNCLMSLPEPPSYTLLQALLEATIPHLTAGVEPTPRGHGKGQRDNVYG